MRLRRIGMRFADALELVFGLDNVERAVVRECGTARRTSAASVV